MKKKKKKKRYTLLSFCFISLSYHARSVIVEASTLHYRNERRSKSIGYARRPSCVVANLEHTASLLMQRERKKKKQTNDTRGGIRHIALIYT